MVRFASKPPSDARWQLLGGLRFVLASMVAAAHLRWFATGAGARLLGGLGATAAVVGFLVISGYSIAHSLHARPGGFYRRRVLRIYPLYAAAVLYALLPFALGGNPLSRPGFAFTIPRPPVGVVVGNLLMLQNVACPPMDSDVVLWTLGVEVACYGAAPWLRRWPTVAVVGVAVVSGGAFAWYPRSGLPHYGALVYGWPLLLFAWAWLAGFLLHRHRSSTGTAVLVALVGTVLVVVNSDSYSVPTYLATVALIALSVRVSMPAVVGRALSYLGDLSYPLYLFHLPTYLLAYCVLHVNGLAGLVVSAVSVSAAMLLVDVTVKSALARRSRGTTVPARPALVGDGA